MIDQYFHDFEVRSDFKKEYVSIFDGWLGKERLHQLDNVSPSQWRQFRDFLVLLHQNYTLHQTQLRSATCSKIENIDAVFDDLGTSKEKEASDFTRIIIPELRVVYTEDWDYTWIIWYRHEKAIVALSPLIKQSGLFHWGDAK